MPLRVALVGVNSPGYRSLALGYLRAYSQADSRLSGVAFTTFELDTDVDPWWIAYRVLGLHPAPDVVAFSVTCWNARHVYEAARIIKAALPRVLVVLGGPEVGPVAEVVLRGHPEADAVVRGEGEVTFAELLGRLVESGLAADLSDVAGLTSRLGDGVVSAPDRALIAELDSIPSPYLAGVMEPSDGSTYLETYRGCPHRCAYCFEGKGYGRLRRFSEERIAVEIELIAGSPDVRTFSFIDPVFNLTADRLAWFAEQMSPHVSRGIRLHTIEVDIERIGPNEAALLQEAGVASVETGPQSVGRAALATCKREFDRDRFSAGVKALKAQGISVECDLIIGLPGDTPSDVVAGLDFTTSLDPGTVQVSTLRVLPGTDLWHRAEELGVRYDADPPHEVVATDSMDFRVLRRLEALGVAVGTVYRAR